MNKVEGLHHLAISTANMRQIEFFTDKLGMELVALLDAWRRTWHGFLRPMMKAASLLSAIQVGKIEVRMGETHAGNPGANSARGTMQHLALKVRNHDELLAMRDRLRSKGYLY